MDSPPSRGPRQAALALLALAIALLALPSLAAANVVCVNVSPTAGCNATASTIQNAVTTAVDGDTVKIGPGVYSQAVTSTERIHFVGAGAGTFGQEPGPGDTVIAPASGMALSITSGSITGVRLRGGPGDPVIGLGSAALGINLMAGTAEVHVKDVVGQGGNAGTGITAMPGGGLLAGAMSPGTLDLTVEGGGFSSGTGGTFGGGGGASVSGPGDYVFDRVNLRGSSSGIGSGMGLSVASGIAGEMPTVSFRNGRIDSTSTGVNVFGGNLEVVRSRVTGTGAGLSASGPFMGGGNSSVKVIDSLVEGKLQPALPIMAVNAVAVSSGLMGGASFEARGSTFIARGSTTSNAAISLPSPGMGPFTASADLKNSVMHAEGTGAADLMTQGGTITASHSHFQTSQGAGAPAPGSGTNLTGDPGLGADFAPQAGSKLIDAGDPAFADANGKDVAGSARVQDGDGDCNAKPDIGAFERAGTCAQGSGGNPPAAPPAALSVSRFGLTNKVFAPVGVKANRSAKKVKRGTTFRYTLSADASLTIAIERVLPGRRKGRRCVAPKRGLKGKRCTRYQRKGTLVAKGKAGVGSTFFSGKIKRRALAPGRYRARLIAKGANGKAAPERTLSFRIVRP